MLTPIELKEQPPQPALSVRVTAGAQDLPLVLGKALSSIIEYLWKIGEYPTGSPFVVYHNMDMQKLDVEIGFPIWHKLPGRGDIQPSELPGGKCVTMLCTESYDQLESAHQVLSQWVTEHGYELNGVAYEFYLSDAETLTQDLKTQILYPLK